METRVDDLFYKELGHQLDIQRLKLGYSLKYVSKLTGISFSELDKCFLGKRRMKKENYNLICNALEIKPNINLTVSVG